ncbi:MAG TPA: hypothetical protein VJB05_02955, partial [archaeon]|nr:hypothetical protein [archaeon]
MRIIKKFPKDDRGEFVSRIFDRIITKGDYHLPFAQLEFHLRDSNMSKVEDEKALICIDYNNPLILEKDQRGVNTLIRHELFRLMFKMNLPRAVEDVIIGREMIKRGFGDDIFYMYYNRILKMNVSNVEEYIKINLPWIIFHEQDKYNSELLKKIVGKVCKKKYPETKKLFDILCGISPKNVHEAASIYGKISR